MRRTRRRPLPRHIGVPAVCAGLRAGPRRRLDALARAAGQLAVGGAGAGRQRVLRRRLHDVAQATYVAEHRLGRRRRLLPDPDRLDRGHRLSWRWPPVVLFLVVFFWTPPHFWALAMRYREDYAAAGVPMLPVVATRACRRSSDPRLHRVTVATSLVLWPVAHTGPSTRSSPWCSGRASSARRHSCSARSRSSDDLAVLQPMRLFHFSNLYLTLLFLAVAAGAVRRMSPRPCTGSAARQSTSASSSSASSRASEYHTDRHSSSIGEGRQAGASGPWASSR